MNFASEAKEANPMPRLLVVLAGLVTMAGLSGCVVVGWSSAGGGFIWPGGLGLLVMVLLVVWLVRRR
jgi:hypothetical protein